MANLRFKEGNMLYVDLNPCRTHVETRVSENNGGKKKKEKKTFC